jgi:hypothetical protein
MAMQAGQLLSVIPAQAGIQGYRKTWVPAFAGTTEKSLFRGNDRATR